VSVVLSEHLPLLASAPNGIQKLRGLIYELAARGKLTVPDSGTPASSVQLGEVAEFVMGQAPPGSECNTNGVGTIFVKTGEFGEEFPVVREWTTKPLKFAKRGDVLICVVGATVGKLNMAIDCAIGRSVAAIRPCNTLDSRYLYVALVPFTLRLRSQSRGSAQGVIGKSELGQVEIRHPSLAEQHRIVAKVDELMALCDRLEQEVGAGGTVHAKLVETLLGTLNQSTNAADLAANWQRLAEHFDTLFTTEASIDALKQTILQLAVMGKLVPQDPNDEPASELLKRIAKERAKLEAEGKIKKSKPLPPVGEDEQPFVAPAGWEWVRFGAIATTRLGKMLDAAKNRGDLKPYLRNSNVQWFQFELDDIKEMRLAPDELDELRLEDGDLLICEGGEPGRCAIWRSATEEMYFQKALHRARPNGGVLAEYLQMILRQDAVSGALGAYFTGATIKHFAGDKLTAYVIPLPPVKEQNRIVAKVDELMALCDRLKADIAESRTLSSKLSATVADAVLESL